MTNPNQPAPEKCCPRCLSVTKTHFFQNAYGSGCSPENHHPWHGVLPVEPQPTFNMTEWRLQHTLLNTLKDVASGHYSPRSAVEMICDDFGHTLMAEFGQDGVEAAAEPVPVVPPQRILNASWKACRHPVYLNTSYCELCGSLDASENGQTNAEANAGNSEAEKSVPLAKSSGGDGASRAGQQAVENAASAACLIPNGKQPGMTVDGWDLSAEAHGVVPQGAEQFDTLAWIRSEAISKKRWTWADPGKGLSREEATVELLKAYHAAASQADTPFHVCGKPMRFIATDGPNKVWTCDTPKCRSEEHDNESQAENAELRRDLDVLNRILTQGHSILDAAKVPIAMWAECNDPDCDSQLIHRLKELVKSRDQAREALRSIVAEGHRHNDPERIWQKAKDALRVSPSEDAPATPQPTELERKHAARTKLNMKFWTAMHMAGITDEWEAQEKIHIGDLVHLLTPDGAEPAAQPAGKAEHTEILAAYWCCLRLHLQRIESETGAMRCSIESFEARAESLLKKEGLEP